MIEDIESANGWLIHQYPIRDSLSLVYILTSDRLLKAFYRLPKTKGYVIKPQAFSPYWVSWQERKGACNIKSLELAAHPLELQGLKLFVGLYLNELIFKLCKHDEITPDFYCLYEQLLADIEPCNELLLRQFEWQLLADCGYAIDFSRTIQNQEIQSKHSYHFSPEQGFSYHEQGFEGADLLAIHQQDFKNEQAYMVFKKVLRMMIDHVLEYQPLHSRKLLQEWLKGM